MSEQRPKNREVPPPVLEAGTPAYATRLTATRRGEDERGQRPLDLALIRRLWAYAAPHRRTRNVLLGLVTLRSVQIPATAWILASVLNGPVQRGT